LAWSGSITSPHRVGHGPSQRVSLHSCSVSSSKSPLLVPRCPLSGVLSERS